MSIDDDDVDQRRDDQWVLDAWPAAAPPPGFAEAVVARARRATQVAPPSSAPLPLPRPRRRFWPAAVAAAGLSAVVLAFVVVDGRSSSGELVAVGRRAQSVGPRATVVAEDGARLSWRAEGGAVVVTQAHGDVFYRVDPGSDPFAVETPDGRLTVLGTCFRVVVPDAPPSSTETAMTTTTRRSGLLGTAFGMVVAGTVVHVYEGKVALANSHGTVDVAAGDSASADKGGPPRGLPSEEAPALRRKVESLLADRAGLETQLQEALSAASGDTKTLVLTNQDLHRQIAELQAEQAKARALANDAPVPFPADLPPRFQQAALLAAVQKVFAEKQVKGEVTAVDCSEYPCVVFGTVDADDAEVFRSAKALDAYADDSRHSWGTNASNDKDAGRLFAIGLAPSDPTLDDDERERRSARIDGRVKDMFKTMKPPAEPSATPPAK